MDLNDFGLVPHQTESIKIGDKFERLTIIGVGKIPGTYDYRAVYQCSCGTIGQAQISGIKIGHWKSCGCWSKDRSKKHGLWKSPLYIVWRHMMSRCHNESNERYADYGGRGITVCERWHDVAAFAEDMSPTYKRGLLIERIDNNKGYEPSNVVWATRAQQQRNKRNNIQVTMNGKTQVLKDWCTELGLNYHAIYYRVKEKGMDPVLALSTPLIKGRRLPN